MACKHENADHLKTGDSIDDWDAPARGRVALAGCLICLDCGAWLSLGPSNDRIPRDEKWLAAKLLDVHLLWEPGQARDEMIRIAVDDVAMYGAGR